MRRRKQVSEMKKIAFILMVILQFSASVYAITPDDIAKYSDSELIEAINDIGSITANESDIVTKNIALTVLMKEAKK